MGVKMRIAVCDNEIQEIQTVRNLIRDYVFEVKQIDCFKSGEDFVMELDKKQYDLVFMDIYMEGISGIEAACAAKKHSPKTEIVFTTVSRDFAVEAFNINALHYIVKPVTPGQIKKAINRYYKKRRKIAYLEVQSGHDNIKLRLEDVCYLQSRNNGTDIFLQNDMLHINMNTTSLAEQLNYLFLNIRRGMYVSMNYIVRMESDCCILKNGEKVLLSRKERPKIRSRYKEYIYRSLEEEEI